jgi:hypothetical protein
LRRFLINAVNIEPGYTAASAPFGGSITLIVGMLENKTCGRVRMAESETNSKLAVLAVGCVWDLVVRLGLFDCDMNASDWFRVCLY